MARIAGIDLPKDKRVEIGLTYIFGIGQKTSAKILAEPGVDPDIRVKDLSSKEYYSGKNEGYLRFHIDIAKLAKLILENDDIADALEEAGKKSKVDYEELLGSLKGDIAIAVEVSGTDVFIIAGGALNQKADTLNKFASTFGATNPIKVPMNEKICKEALDGAIETYISKAKAAMAKVSAGNNTTTETETDDDE